MKTGALPTTYFEGAYTPIENAKVSIMTNALQYGTAWFGGIRAYKQQDGSVGIFRLKDHVARFASSSKLLGVAIDTSPEQIEKIILELGRRNEPTGDTYIRPFAYASETNLSPNLAENHTFRFACYMFPLGDYIATDRGNRVIVSSWTRIDDTIIPPRGKISGGYINSALAKQEAIAQGMDECIMLNRSGKVCEGSSMNIFIVRDGTLITPTITDGILEGITRRSIIEIAHNLNIPVIERSVERTELYVADEVFFSGTGAQVAWVQEIDRRVIGAGTMGPVSTQIKDVFMSAVRGQDKKYSKWITKI